jgi:hypothetical protein
LEAPSTEGSASGLRRNPCSAAPPSPSIAPTAIPRIARGIRSSSTIVRATGSPCPIRAAITRVRPIGALPIASDKAKAATASTFSPAISRVRWNFGAGDICAAMSLQDRGGQGARRAVGVP